MQAQRIRSVRPLGRKRALDFEVAHKDHNFYAEGVVVSNCHAQAYALITARCLYLKLNHPVEFWCETLMMNRNDANKYENLASIEREMRMTGYRLLPPRFSSAMDFVIESPTEIRFALGMIRGVSDKSLPKLATFISAGGVKDGLSKFAVFQALKNAGLHIGMCSALIQAGCMEGYEVYRKKDGTEYRSRSRLVLEAQTWNLLNDTDKRLCIDVGAKPEVNWDVIAALKLCGTLTNEKGKPLIREIHLNKLRREYAPYAEIYEMNSRNERLANYVYERVCLGYSYSEDIASIFGDKVDGLIPLTEAEQLPQGTRCKVIGFVSDPAKAKTKKGNDEFRFILSDETSQLRIKAFNDRIGQIEQQNGRLPEDDDLVICNLRIMDGGVAFVESGLDGVLVGIQTAQIYTRLAQLKDAKAQKSAESASIATESA